MLLMAACALHSLLRPLLRIFLKHVWPLRVLAVLWQTGSSVAGTILLTPFFLRSLTASPPVSSTLFLTLPLATSTSPLPLVLSMVTAFALLAAGYTR